MADDATCKHCQEPIRRGADGVQALGAWWHVPAHLPLYDCATGGTVAEPEESNADDR